VCRGDTNTFLQIKKLTFELTFCKAQLDLQDIMQQYASSDNKYKHITPVCFTIIVSR